MFFAPPPPPPPPTQIVHVPYVLGQYEMTGETLSDLYSGHEESFSADATYETGSSQDQTIDTDRIAGVTGDPQSAIKPPLRIESYAPLSDNEIRVQFLARRYAGRVLEVEDCARLEILTARMRAVVSRLDEHAVNSFEEAEECMRDLDEFTKEIEREHFGK